MKRIIFFSLLSLYITAVIISCKENPEREVLKKGLKAPDAEYPKVFTYHRDDVEQYTDAIVLASDGHEYWIHLKSDSSERMEHYWNCKTCKK